MSKKEEANLEGGLPSHEEIKLGSKPEIMGQEPYVFRVDGKEWGNLPKDWTLREATAVGVNSKDQVIVFNRGTKPIIIFDPNGKYIDSWGDDIFKNPHGITIDDDDLSGSDIEKNSIILFLRMGFLRKSGRFAKITIIFPA